MSDGVHTIIVSLVNYYIIAKKRDAAHRVSTKNATKKTVPGNSGNRWGGFATCDYIVDLRL